MDNTSGQHVAFTQLIEGGSGPSRFENRTLHYDRSLGPLRQSETIDATAICFRWWPADFSGTFNNAAGKRVILVTEGAVTVQSEMARAGRFD